MIQAIAEHTTATAPGIKVEVDQSNDNRIWTTKATAPIGNASAWSPSTSAVDNIFGTDTGPNGAFVRLKITVTGST